MIPTQFQFGDEPKREWREHSEIPSAHDEEQDSEEATPEEKDFVKSTLGFKPDILFSDES